GVFLCGQRPSFAPSANPSTSAVSISLSLGGDPPLALCRRHASHHDPLAGKLVRLRYSAGLSIAQAAERLGSPRLPPLELWPGLVAWSTVGQKQERTSHDTPSPAARQPSPDLVTSDSLP